MSFDDAEALRARIAQLEVELKAKNEEIEKLQRAQKAAEVADGAVSVGEYEDTLKRLVQRIAMILQAEKCAILIRERDTGDLVGQPPAFGIQEEDLRAFRVKSGEGITGEVFRTETAAIFNDALNDPRAVKPIFEKLRIKNGVAVPLVVEKRDEDNRLLERANIGVIGVFNKRYSGEFIEEDVKLLERLARNAAAVIASAQLFRELLEEREKLAHTIESLYAGLILISGTGNIIQMNARARQIFQVNDDPIGKPFTNVIKHDKAAELLARMISAGDVGDLAQDEETKAAEEITVTEPETDEDRVYQIHAAEVKGEDGRLIGSAIILNDVTELRNLDRMKTEFVAIAAHELRTPTTPIKGFISMLAQDEFDSFGYDERKEYYQIIEQNVDRLGRLINDLLSVTRIERGVAQQLFWEEVNLCELADTVFEIQRGMTNTDKHPLVLDSVPDPIIATVGRDQLEQILQNLVSNAIKYSPDGGEVRIQMRHEPEDDTVLIGVTDHGTGIPESAKSKLFKPYRRIHNPRTASVKGTGIGLFLVKSLVEAHHGTIWVDTELGKGTTFWFRIPKTPPEEARVEASDAATA